MKKLFALIALISLTSSCSILDSLLYTPDVFQGNVIDDKMVGKLKKNMTKKQVAYILGEPIMDNIYDDVTWHYVYLINESSNNSYYKRNLDIVFNKNGRVIKIIDNKS